MTVHYLGSPKFREFDSNGAPLASGKLYTYEPGVTAIAKTAFQDADGATPHANPIILDANGRAEIWLSGLYYLVLDNASDVNQWTMDQVHGAGFQAAAAVTDEWTERTETPTHIDDTNFSVPGDLRTTYQVGRRVRATIGAGTIYGTMTASVFTTVTTITLLLDSGVLDSGLSAIAVGFLSVTNSSIPGVTLSGDDWSFQGNNTVAGTLGVTGAATFAATVGVTGAVDVTGRLTAPGMLSPGSFAYSLLTTMNGWKLCFGQSIGSTASAATDNDDANETLFTAVWDACADAECPVSGGRGASAAADWAANKTLTLPDGRGAGLIGLDNMGGSSANIVTDAEADTMGDFGGAEDVTLADANVPAHTHGAAANHTHPQATNTQLSSGGANNDPSGSPGTQTQGGTTGAGGGHTHNSFGSGTAFSVMNPYLAAHLFVRS